MDGHRYLICQIKNVIVYNHRSDHSLIWLRILAYALLSVCLLAVITAQCQFCQWVFVGPLTWVAST